MNLAKFLHRKDGDQYDDVAIKVSLFLNWSALRNTLKGEIFF